MTKKNIIIFRDRLINNVWIYVVLGIIVSSVMYVFIPEVVGRINLICQRTEFNYTQDIRVTEVAESGTTVIQTFKSPYKNIKEIEVLLGTYGNVNEGNIYLALIDNTSGEELALIRKDLMLLKDNQFAEFTFSRAIELDEKHLYAIKIWVETENNEDKIALYLVDNVYEEGTLYLSNEEQDAGLCFALSGYNDGCSNKRIFWGIQTFFVIFIMLMIYQIVNERNFVDARAVEFIFPILGLLACCTLFSQGGDMKITIRHAQELISALCQGEFGDFYTVVLKKALGGEYYISSITDAANYNIFLYLLLAICIMPCSIMTKLFNVTFTDSFMIVYFNIILTVVVFYATYLIFKLAIDMEINRRKALNISFFFISSMLLMFTTVGFSQLDMFYVVFVIAALRRYLKQQYISFSLIMSVAIMLKSFPILMFVPLILLVEKRVIHIIKYLFLGVSSSIIFGLAFGNSVGYSYTKTELNAIYGFAKRLFVNGISGGMGICAFFIFTVVIVCIWCFDKEIKQNETWKYIVVIPLTVYGAFMMFVGWHPQWLAIITPFIALAVGIDTNRRSSIYCEWGISVLYCIISALRYSRNADNYMVNEGVLPMITGYRYSGIPLADIVNNIDNLSAAVTSVFASLIFCFCFNSFRDILKMNGVNEYSEIYLERWVVLARCASIYFLCLLFLVLYFYVG